MATRQALGRGLGALIGDARKGEPGVSTRADGALKIPLDKIATSKWQPRRRMEKEALSELAESVKKRGVLQPLLVRAVNDRYELIAGERRFLAARQAGLTEVPVIVMQAADNEVLELALIENLQREDLNPIEEAEAYRMLADEFELTQEQVAERIGKARATVANAVRLLDLPREVTDMVSAGIISAGHAKALTALQIAGEQILYAQRAAKEHLSVRQFEKLVQKAGSVPRKPRATRDDIPPDYVAHLSDRLHAHFGTAVRVITCKTYANGKKKTGRVEVDFYSADDLDRILAVLGIGDL